MNLIADGLLIAAALSAAIYCHVLARRLRRLRDLDGGVGAAIASLSSQVEEMRAALRDARAASGEATRSLSDKTARAEDAARRLELLLASLRDREDAGPNTTTKAGSGQAVNARWPLSGAVAPSTSNEPESSRLEVFGRSVHRSSKDQSEEKAFFGDVEAGSKPLKKDKSESPSDAEADLPTSSLKAEIRRIPRAEETDAEGTSTKPPRETARAARKRGNAKALKEALASLSKEERSE